MSRYVINSKVASDSTALELRIAVIFVQEGTFMCFYGRGAGHFFNHLVLEHAYYGSVTQILNMGI